MRRKRIKWKYQIFLKKIHSKLSKNNYVKIFQKAPREIKVLFFFWFLFLIIFIRLFQLQIVQADDYRWKLVAQHSTHTTLEAKRWNIYLTDNSGNPMKLTENIDIYTLYVDPWLIKEQSRFVEKISPILYEHFCKIYWLTEPDKTTCIRNIEDFSWEDILPEQEQTFFMTGETQQLLLDEESFEQETQQAIDEFEKEQWIELIKEKLMDITKWWTRTHNYFWYFDNNAFLRQLQDLDKEYIVVEWNYLYFVPDKVEDISQAAKIIYTIVQEYWYNYTYQAIYSNLEERPIRYVRLATNVSWQVIAKVRDLKAEYFSDRTDWVPLLHWLWYEQNQKRYYPYWPFSSHVLGYLNNEWMPFYWVEEYFDSTLKWQDGQIIWASVPWIWMIWSNELEMQQPVDWSDVYLTIDPTIQKNVEQIAKDYYAELDPDNISVIVMDPHTWKIKASVNYPNFDPNNYSKYYTVQPLSYEKRYIIDEDQYMDIPVLIEDNWNLRVATYSERKDPNLKKYIFNEELWPQTFVDRNISYPSEPGSTFKTFTVAAGVDSDEISLYETYEDEMSVDIWPYTIRNIQDQCQWTNTFLHALDWSCNVGMVRIVQRLGRYVFYSYLEKLWFGKLTWIELANEDPGRITGLEDFSTARLFNNSFGQWLLSTPIQMASAYSTIINWGYRVNPTILDKTYDPETWKYTEFEPKLWKRVFSESTSERMLEAIGELLDMEDEEHLWSMVWLPFYSVWWKSGTSQIAFQGRYQRWEGWTYWWFAWVVTSQDPRYVVISQVRRPRQSQWWSSTAWFVNRDVSKFLIEYSGIEK